MSFSAEQRSIISIAIETQKIPGVAAAIVKDGEILAVEGFGYRNLEKKLPMMANTVSPLCSLSKSFTAVAIMQLVETGKLWLDEPVVSYLPEFRVADAEATRKITPRMLLSHKSGMGRTGHQDQLFHQAESPYQGRADLVAQLTNVKLQTPPNTTFSYSNEGYALLGLLIDTLSGTTLEEYLQTRIFERVGMKDSCIRFDQWRSAENRAYGYAKEGDFNTEDQLPQDYRVYLAGGGICSSAYEMALYQIATLDYAQSPLLSAGLLDMMHSISTPYGDTGYGYGLGWGISWVGQTKVVSHSGGLPGFSTYSLLIPAEQLGVVVLTNRSGVQLDQLARQLADSVLPQPLFAAISTADFPFCTRFAVPDASALQEYVGSYALEQQQVVVELESAETPRLVVTEVSQDGSESKRKPVAAIADDLFMNRHQELYYFLRSAEGRVTSCLMNGRQFQKPSS